MQLDLKMPVLVVDDFRVMVKVVKALLAEVGFQDVDDAPDGPAALARMRERHYGLVISDWNMAPMSGHELLQQVRADAALGKTPFIVMTADSKTDNVLSARRAGADSYIVKPFNASTLRAKITAVCAAAAQADAAASQSVNTAVA